MTIYAIGSELVSPPRAVAEGAVVNVTPAPGGSVLVESTAASSADVANGVAVWLPWPQGSVRGPSSMRANDFLFIRVTASIGGATYEIDEAPSARALQPYRNDWIRPSSAIVSQPAYLGTNICLAGDSIRNQESNIIGGALSTLAGGETAWMLAFLGYPWNFEPTDNFAIGGSTMDAVISSQLPQILAAHGTRAYSRCFLSCGTNDTNNGLYSLDQIKANYMTIFNTLRGAGIIPVHVGIRPRGIDATTTTPKQMNAHINDWLYQQSLSGLIEFINVSEVYADNTTAFGNAITTLMYDSGTFNLHPNQSGACAAGRFMADYYKARGVTPALKLATTQNDIFDRTLNPTGVAFKNANPLLQGGTTAPTGMLTTGGTWSKVPRALANGQSRSDPTCTLAASTLHHIYDDWVAVGAWGATELQPGDVVEVRAKVVLTGAANITSLCVRLSESDGVLSIANMGLSPPGSVVIPLANDTVYLKSPRVTIRPYGGSGNAQIFSRVECQTTAGGTGTMTVQGFELRKVA